MQNIIGNILITIGIMFVIFGVYGIFKFKSFYTRILVASKVDTVGFITILSGLIVLNGASYFSLKILLVIVFVAITNPMITHATARGAYISNYKGKRRSEK